MFDTVKEKLEFEWWNFVHVTMLNSRESIICRAREIYIKDRICQEINELELTEDETALLLGEENALDYLYLKLTGKKEYEPIPVRALIDEILMQIEREGEKDMLEDIIQKCEQEGIVLASRAELEEMGMDISGQNEGEENE